MIVRPAQDLAGAMRHLERALPFDVYDSGCSAPEIVGDGVVLEVLADDGAQVGAFVAILHQYSGGRMLRCAAAGGEPGHDLAGFISKYLTRSARRVGAHTVTFETRRKGLIRRLEPEGFKVAGFILTKSIA